MADAIFFRRFAMSSLKHAALFFVSGAIAAGGWSATALGAITFLDHFNGQTNFTLNPAQGDYAAGSGTAVVSGATVPGTDTGFFGGGDLAYHSTAADQNVEINGPGNIQYTSGTSGGFTVGLWVKVTGSNVYGRAVTLGSPYPANDDFFVVDYGQSHDNYPRSTFSNSGMGSVTLETGAVASLPSWAYIATTVDLTNAEMKMYVYDQSGNQTSMDTASLAGLVTALNDFNPYVTGRIHIGGLQGAGSNLWVDELSIDNEVLSESQITARVGSMVAGHELAVPEPASMALVGLGGLMLIRRRRKA
jgi:hypothetical protein